MTPLEITLSLSCVFLAGIVVFLTFSIREKNRRMDFLRRKNGEARTALLILLAGSVLAPSIFGKIFNAKK